MLRIFADENIAAVREVFRVFGSVTTVPGREITREMLRDVDVLLVRSVLPVDVGLLEGSQVRFVGSATAGTDHVDTHGLISRGIQFRHAPGSNAPSVGDYVVSAILHLAVLHDRDLAELSCAVIGCGAVGSRLAKRLEGLGLTVMRCDPPLHDACLRSGVDSPYVDTDQAIPNADIVTLHVPLHDVAPYPTHGLIGARRLERMKDTAWVINTSRGSVVDERALLRYLDRRSNMSAVVDVWTREPDLSCELLRRAAIATAHIAGYAVEGKLRATYMLRDALSAWLGKEPLSNHPAIPENDLSVERPLEGGGIRTLNDLAGSLYDITADHRALVPICELPPADRPGYFDGLRRNYPERHEFSRFRVDRSSIPPSLTTAIEQGLGIKLS